ncbi:DUF4345 domain-containing protein [Cognatitamlana onchidii]|uniref:DUF4345 domain-containing protein n=1 Tax=Cognatitamlana onchidii TaxID=2562860 RepID=UPI0010A5BBF3|nr:DUF4345 domain-containing protein [Algibacter onchidii]
MRTKEDFKNKIHLIISALIVGPIAFIYGFQPELLFEVNITTPNQYNVFKAIMGLYLGFAIVWILGVSKPKYYKIALVSNMVFMLGLGLGRLLSMGVDGLPSALFVWGTLGELLIGFYGLWVYKRK